MATKTKAKPTVNLRPLSDRIVLRPAEAEERTAGGIYLPDSAREKPLEGEVVSVGIGQLLDNGERVPPSVKVGDKVLYGKYSGMEIKVDGVEFTIVRESELLGVIDG